jgi:hypothetical protein
LRRTAAASSPKSCSRHPAMLPPVGPAGGGRRRKCLAISSIRPRTIISASSALRRRMR